MKISNWLLFVLSLMLSSAQAKELIKHFDSHIVIHQGGQITVTETIEVNAENVLINRGIYRDFPTQYFGAWLTKKEVGFKVLAVTRDGESEPFHSEPMSNGIRVYMGSSEVYLNPGPHQYQLTYQTDQQLGYFKDYDEFYWNVTGTGWQFPINKVTATINLPAQAKQQILDQQAWTGYQGEQNTDYKLTNSDELLGFETTVVLDNYQGLTIGIQVPKGIFDEPPFDLSGFLAVNLVWILAFLVSVFYIGFYLSAWFRHGRDPQPGVIMARFQPPKGLSPAAVHYIDNEVIDDKTLTAGLLSLAVKGHISITQLKNQYQIKKQKSGKMALLSKGESAIKDKLFKGKKSKLTLSKSPNSTLLATKNALIAVLKKEYQKKCFIDNSAYMIWGWVISLFCFFIVTFLIYSASIDTSSLIGLMISYTIFLTLAVAWSLAVPYFAALMIVVFLVTSYMDLWHFMVVHQVWLLFTLFLLGLNLTFAYLLRSPTVFGRHIKDQIDGLKLYMKSAEENRLDLMNPAEKTIEYYESLLPYAVALGLENQWAEKFADIINTEVKTDKNNNSTGYQPVWFQNNTTNQQGFNFSAASVSHSLSRSVASASTIPSASSSSSTSSYSSSSSSSSSSSFSSSSSSSGGSSGGGGGGGGGGGW